MEDKEKTRSVTKDWRVMFPPQLLEIGNKMLRMGRVIYFKSDGNTARALLETKPGFQCTVRAAAPASFDEEWDSRKLTCTCMTKRSYSYRCGTKWQYAEVCQHEAAVLLKWEKEHGPWAFQESPEQRDARLRAEKEREEAKRRERERKQELERLKLLEKEQRRVRLPAASLFPEEERKDLFFDLRRALISFETNQYCAERARALLKTDAVTMQEPRLAYAQNGSQCLAVSGTVRDPAGDRRVTISLLPETLESHRCSCRNDYYLYPFSTELCEHELVLLTRLRGFVRENNPGDATDRAADAFFRAIDASAQEPPAETEEQPRPKRIVLAPKLQVEDGTVSLSYLAGLEGGKQVRLHSYKDFLSAADQRLPFALSKAVTLNFAELDLTDASQPWLTFLRRRISETEVANDSLNRGYYYSATLTVKTRDTLVGAMLDRFYELAEGTAVDVQDRDRKTAGKLRVGHARPRVSLSTAPIKNTGGRMLGVEVRGQMPLILKGSAGSYILDAESLSKITPEEERALRPFLAAAGEAGDICFRVGRDKLAEFYYRVVPRLNQSAYVELSDPCAEEAEALLPPEPRFTFRLDLDAVRQAITCLAMVDYGEGRPHSLPYPDRTGQYRDGAQEQRVLRCVKSWFPDYDNASGLHCLDYSEDRLYQILSGALLELSRFGTVEGSSAFDSSAIRPVPPIRVGVSVESGLLEIDILSKDISPEELLAVLESYRQKKKYHRLRSGAFLRLEENGQLGELDAVSRGMDFSLQDAIRGGVKVPAYRALYLDSLLEEHDALYAGRDRSYRALIKNFKTIRDADYEVPEAQAEMLRPYQAYGYKWLRTLTAAGFGGILADEMGLGKTLQFISLAQALHDAGELQLGLVVCPASLIYNWQEEFRRFAPGIRTEVMTGTAAARKKRIEALAEGTVCITGYDLLRQDIAQYQKKDFSLTVLDEAQYIKNQNASMTKAVKAIRSKLRFALTGTPIENRLAELWSIFDFLMPGFLYSYKDFSQRFETPITRHKETDATEKLKRMTAPFILRRLKAEVLKDLPPKLEELRYTRFEEEQRKVYDGQVVRMKQLVLSGGGSGEDKLRLFAELTRIRQICCDPSLLLEDYHGGSAKRSACLELIRDAIGGGHRMLVFSQFTSMLELLEQDLEQEGIAYYKLTGATPKEERLRLVRDFNEGDTPVFLISLKAGGTGLNLTGADVVIHYDPWWNLAAQNQATDRAHRIGQENEVTVYKIIVKDSIEERILAMQEAKRDLAEAVLSGEGKSISALSTEELLALLG